MSQNVRNRRLLMIAGDKSHGPEGNGIHDYGWDARVCAAMLMRSTVSALITCRVVDGWPGDEDLAWSDAIAVFCDGRDGEHYREALHQADPRAVAQVEALVARGAGVAVLHFGLFAGEGDAERALRWCGGYFQWQGDDGGRAWRSRITTLETSVDVVPGHAATRGLPERFTLREEFYHDLRLADRAVPLLRVPALHGTRRDGDVVAWAVERAGGGRGFGASLGHDHANWALPAYRAALLNGLAWCAGAEIPPGGVQAKHLCRDEAALIIAGRPADAALRVLLLSGNEAHRWHNWPTTGPAIASALTRDRRIAVDAITDVSELARRDLGSYDAIALNWCNWQDPAGASPGARTALAAFVAAGGGLIVIHFANGALHGSLPGAADSDWPEYRRLVRRVWDHHGDSAHDDFATFVASPRGEHPIVAGLEPFAVADELYVRQVGDEPIAAMLEAPSRLTGATEPLAWAYRYGRGRVFQTLLGHSERTYDAFAAREMLRRAAAWVAGRELRSLTPVDDTAIAALTATTGRLQP
ncbi:MAG: ThuA domain-containing protein [Planctomycetes bacterium]|nr:ThuA domain-containing protein [Planctomycetota bacterium]